MPCIWGTVLVVVARLRAAAVLRLSWDWCGDDPGGVSGVAAPGAVDMMVASRRWSGPGHAQEPTHARRLRTPPIKQSVAVHCNVADLGSTYRVKFRSKVLTI